jgi:membrane protein YqaA with SNARE-associated domain
MRRSLIPAWLRTTLAASAADRYYPLVVAFFAFAVTLTFSFPFAAMLVPATLLAPQRWLSLGLLCGLGSGLGASALVQVFHSVGWEAIAQHYPELVQMESWQWANEWLLRYGLLALLVIAASPMPQTPALLVYAMVDPFWPGVVLAIGTGKALKYTLLTWLTARYPGRFLKFD